MQKKHTFVWSQIYGCYCISLKRSFKTQAHIDVKQRTEAFYFMPGHLLSGGGGTFGEKKKENSDYWFFKASW